MDKALAKIEDRYWKVGAAFPFKEQTPKILQFGQAVDHVGGRIGTLASGPVNLLKKGLGQIAQGFAIAFKFTLAFNALRLLETGFAKLLGVITSGIKKLDDFRLQIAEVAGILSIVTQKLDATSFSKFKDFAAEARIQLELLGTTALATGEEIFAGFLELTERGIILNTTKEFEDLLNVVNAISLVAQGTGRPLQQIKQELRLLLEGNIRPGAELVQLVKAINPELLEQIKSYTTMEQRAKAIFKFFEPFKKVQEEINNTLTGQLKKFQKIFDIISRIAAQKALDLLVQTFKDINNSLLQGGELTEKGARFVVIMETSWRAVEAAILAGWEALKLLASILSVIVPMPEQFAKNATDVEKTLYNLAAGTARGFLLLAEIINVLHGAILILGEAAVAALAGFAFSQGDFEGAKKLTKQFFDLSKAADKSRAELDRLDKAYIELAKGPQEFNKALSKSKESLEDVQKILQQSAKRHTFFVSVEPADAFSKEVLVNSKFLTDFPKQVVIGLQVEASADLQAFLSAQKIVEQKKREVGSVASLVLEGKATGADFAVIKKEYQESINFALQLQEEAQESSQKVADIKNAALTASEGFSIFSVRGIKALQTLLRPLQETLDKFADIGALIAASGALDIIQEQERDLRVTEAQTKALSEGNEALADRIEMTDKARKAAEKAFVGQQFEGIPKEEMDILRGRIFAIVYAQELAKSKGDEFKAALKDTAKGADEQAQAFEALTKKLLELSLIGLDPAAAAVTKAGNELVEFEKMLKEAGQSSTEFGKLAREAFQRSIGLDLSEPARELARGFEDTNRELIIRNQVLADSENLTMEQIDSMVELLAQNEKLEAIYRKLGDSEEFASLAASVMREELDKSTASSIEAIEKTDALTKANKTWAEAIKFAEDAIENIPKELEKAKLGMQALNEIQAQGLPITQENIDAYIELSEILKKIAELPPGRIDLREGLQKEFRDKVEALSLQRELDEQIENAEDTFKILQKLAEETADDIRESFADFFFAAFKGDLDSFKDVWDAFLDALLRSFADFIALLLFQKAGLEKLFKNLFKQDSGIPIPGGLPGGAGGGGGTDIFQSIVGGFGIGSDIAGLFGGGAAAVGGLGGFAAGGLSSVGTATFGATSVLDVAAAGGGITAVTAGAEGATGLMATISAALPWIGVALAAAGFIISFILPLLKKTPHYAFKFESIETEVGERAVMVKEFLDADLFSDEIFKTLSSHGGKGAFSGKEREELKEQIQKTIEDTIKSIQDIIFKLPADMAKLLNEALLNTSVDMESKIGRSNLLGFDAKGAKEIQKRLEKFFQGELQARFLESIRSFFEGAFIALGVLPEKAQEIIDKQFEEFQAAKSPEERAKIGAELLATFEAFVDVFNIATGHVNDAVGNAITSIKRLSGELGFAEDSIPSMADLQSFAQAMLETGEVTPETAEKLMMLRDAILDVNAAIADSISNLVSMLQDVNNKIVAFGGEQLDFSGPLQASIDQIQALIMGGGLSPDELERFLGIMKGQVDQWVGEQERQAKSQVDAQKSQIDSQISSLERQKTLIEESYKKRIDALEEELSIAEDLANLVKEIQENIFSLLTGNLSIEGVFARLARFQAEISNLFDDLTGATDEEKLTLGKRIQELLNDSLGLAAEIFQTPSLEFRDEFRKTIQQLEELQALVGPTRSIEEISAEIEKLNREMDKKLAAIDASIEAMRSRSEALSNQQISISKQAQEQARAYYEFIQQEALKLLEERLKQLAEIGIDTSSALTSTEQLHATTNEILTQIRDLIAGVQSMQHGGFIEKGAGQLALLHGPEYVIPQDQLASLLSTRLHKMGSGDGAARGYMIGDLNVTINGNVDSPERVHEISQEFKKVLRTELSYLYRDPKFRRDNNLNG